MVCPKCGSKMKTFSKEQICTNPECKYIKWKKSKELLLKEIAHKDRLDEEHKTGSDDF